MIKSDAVSDIGGTIDGAGILRVRRETWSVEGRKCSGRKIVNKTSLEEFRGLRLPSRLHAQLPSVLGHGQRSKIQREGMWRELATSSDGSSGNWDIQDAIIRLLLVRSVLPSWPMRDF